jgi:iron complex transport system permease protein
MLTLIVAVLLTALAVAVAGPVGLIALVAPELARYLNSYKSVPLINAGLVGAITMVATDLVGRTALSPIEIPVGVITAVVGGPYLLWILLRPDRR